MTKLYIGCVLLYAAFSVCKLLSFFYSFDVYFFFILMIALIFVVVLILLIPFFFPGYYVTELMMSFLPYLIWMAGIFLLISFMQLRKKMKPGYPHLSQRYFRGISFLVFCVLFFVWSRQFNRFYISEPLSQDASSWAITVFFANIHKNNTHYDELTSIISENDPDILMFVEFADHHYDHLKTFLQKHYPYTNNISRSKSFIGSMVFSKYPINNKADDFPQGAWRYGYFSFPYSGQELYMYLVHVSSPDSYNHFLMRNEQLQKFVNDFQIHESDRKHDNVLVVWDFNITPRSSYYDILSSTFSWELNNTTSHIPFLLTWKLMGLPFARAHIDHLWTTPSIAVEHMKAISIPGSDHKWFLFDLTLNH